MRLNLSGYAVQVMANPSFHVFQHAAGILPQDYPPESKQVFSEGKTILAKAFDLDSAEIPTWMFRTGRNDPIPDKMRTLRRDLSDVVQ